MAPNVTPTVAVVINPIAGTGGRPDVARDRAERAAAWLSARGLDGPAAQILVTERSGHARELTLAALAQGTTTVVAWGGDGTVNEVASALAFRDASLAVVPSGSGNGLARDLQIPMNPDHAFDVALDGRVCRIDAGELDGRLFVNVAGIGLDAHVAQEFAAGGLSKRGLSRYAAVTARALFTYRADDHTVVTDGTIRHLRPLLIAIANGRQYGNGAMIAPSARLDDGKLDVVTVAARSPLAAMMAIPRLFMGRIADVRGVESVPAVDIRVTSAHAVLYHVDGEPFRGNVSIAARVRPRALRVAVPHDARPDLSSE
ncbi:MAG: diacylglycerol kinase family lipid kinase [Acidobacteria bacterium]|nr:diacylglycerol kinase family lipid kinase [Acidobacteriota bacterium]